MTRATLVLVLVLALAAAPARAGELDALGADDVHEVARAVDAITAQPASPDLLFAAGRACEDKLLDPARAAAIYARVVADHPSARVATAAAHRLAALRPLLGADNAAARPAAALAQLIAHADALPASAVYQQAVALAATDGPDAPAAALWLADWLRRSERTLEARAHYARVIARWPHAHEAQQAYRGGAGCALDAHDWQLAEALARRLAVDDPGDRASRDDLLGLAARGRRRDRGYLLAWLGFAVALVVLAGSLARATQRSAPGTRRSTLRPPIEVLLLAPIAAVLVGIAVASYRAIAPAVATIALGGLALAYVSGAGLDRWHALGRARWLRTALHLALCLAGVGCLVYIAITHGGLIDSLGDQ
jgi:hypothetical protein